MNRVYDGKLRDSLIYHNENVKGLKSRALLGHAHDYEFVSQNRRFQTDTKYGKY